MDSTGQLTVVVDAGTVVVTGPVGAVVASEGQPQLKLKRYWHMAGQQAQLVMPSKLLQLVTLGSGILRESWLQTHES